MVQSLQNACAAPQPNASICVESNSMHAGNTLSENFVSGGGTRFELTSGDQFFAQHNKPAMLDEDTAKKDTSLVWLTAAQARIMAVLAQVDGGPLSRKQIAAMAGCCDRTVRRALPRFVDMGLLAITHRFKEDGGQLSNAYRVTAQGMCALASRESTRGCERSSFEKTSSLGP